MGCSLQGLWMVGQKSHPQPPFHQKQPPVPTHAPNTEHRKEATHPILTTELLKAPGFWAALLPPLHSTGSLQNLWPLGSLSLSSLPALPHQAAQRWTLQGERQFPAPAWGLPLVLHEMENRREEEEIKTVVQKDLTC